MQPITKLLAKSYYRAKGHVPTNIAGEEFRCHPQHISFWKRLRQGRWEPDTFRVLDLLTPMSTYWDVGAWIGPTVLYAARRARHVVCLEPDPVAYEFLLANVRLNQLRNVTPFNLALHEQSGIFPIGNRQTLGDSSSSLLCTEAAADAARIPCLTLDAFVSLFAPPAPNMIKMDVEGAEFGLVPQMEAFLRRHKPMLYLSLHAPYLPASERLEKLRRLRDVLRIYGRCLNSRQEVGGHDALVQEDVCEQYPAFLFCD
jgi:FkbM family methyltransferase